MKRKDFKRYTKEEQKELLLHWWAYMDVVPYSLVDIKMFEELIDKEPWKMFRAAFAAHWKDRPFTKNMLLNYIRHYTYFKDYGTLFEVSSYFAKEFLSKREMDAFLDKVVDSYNRPRLDVPLVRDCVFVEDSCDISSEDVSKLTEKKVNDLFSRCIIKDVNNDSFGVYGDFTIGEGFSGPASVFRTSSINENMKEIAECISMLPSIEEGVSVLNLGSNKYGQRWTENLAMIDALVRLGIASDLLYFLFSKDEWDKLPGGMPFVIGNKYEKEHVIEGHKVNEYTKVVLGYKNN